MATKPASEVNAAERADAAAEQERKDDELLRTASREAVNAAGITNGMQRSEMLRRLKIQLGVPA